MLADTTIQFEYRTMAAFILSSICNNYSKGQVSGCGVKLLIVMNFENVTFYFLIFITGGVSSR